MKWLIENKVTNADWELWFGSNSIAHAKEIEEIRLLYYPSAAVDMSEKIIHIQSKIQIMLIRKSDEEKDEIININYGWQKTRNLFR